MSVLKAQPRQRIYLLQCMSVTSPCILGLRYEDFVDIFGGHHKIGLYLGVISMHFKVFS